MVRRVETRDLHLVPFDERLAATCGCEGGLDVVPRYALVVRDLGVEVLGSRVWALELGG